MLASTSYARTAASSSHCCRRGGASHRLNVLHTYSTRHTHRRTSQQRVRGPHQGHPATQATSNQLCTRVDTCCIWGYTV
jgi:hypothetical protein